MKNYLFLVLLFLLSSCNDSNLEYELDNSENLQNNTEVDDFAVSEEIATIISNNYMEMNNVPITKSNISLKTVYDNNNEPAIYIINYNDEGFTIISADKRSYPILAYSDSNSFYNNDTIPIYVEKWIDNTTYSIETQRLDNSPQNSILKNIWDNYLGLNTKSTVDGSYTMTYVLDVPALLSTTWNQSGTGYNDYMPLLSNGNNAYAGCVTVAVSQIMNYHEYPDIYDWSSMGTTGSDATALLFADVADKLDADYDTDGTSITTEDVVGLVLDYGYSSSSYVDYSTSTLQYQLKYKRPVIIRGGESGFLGYYKNGHAWVCDGGTVINYVSTELEEPLVRSIMSYTTAHYHMNWGWGGVCNGFYSSGGFSNDYGDFNYKNKIVTIAR
ncbi:MAG: C10 family peptidase [bacterium]